MIPCDLKADVNERVLDIRRIGNSATGGPIATAILSDFTVNGQNFFEDGAARTGGGSGAEVVSAKEIRCTTPCKFGTEPSRYSFLVSTSGFQPKRVEFLADWLNKSEGCPVVVSGATVVEFQLDPQP